MRMINGTFEVRNAKEEPYETDVHGRLKTATAAMRMFRQQSDILREGLESCVQSGRRTMWQKMQLFRCCQINSRQPNIYYCANQSVNQMFVIMTDE